MEEGEPRVPKTRINEMLARCDAAEAAAEAAAPAAEMGAAEFKAEFEFMTGRKWPGKGLGKRPSSAVDKADDAPGPARMGLRKRAAFLRSAQDCIGAEQLALEEVASDLSDPLAFEKEKLALEQAKLAVEREKLALDKAKLALKADEFAQELEQRKERFAQELAQREQLDKLELDKKDTALRTEWFNRQI
jgi:hypothetical protein